MSKTFPLFPNNANQETNPWLANKIPKGAKINTERALALTDQSKKEKEAGIKAK